ncbi:hypothetical protein A2W24_05715 [Microgenomates group bacterium RBG_16_45_19]|nr:MAG: hypothetical protein A2W24_05715 [Microgenomates group bacterium RBG_16_45_19]
MLIGIDGNEANVPQRVGSNFYAYEIIHALSRLNSQYQYLIYLKRPPLPDLPPSNLGWHYRVLRPGRLWTQWRLPLDLYLYPRRLQLFYTPGHYAPRSAPVPTLVTILDLAFLHYPSLFLKTKRGVAQLKTWTEYSVQQAAYVFTISQHTQTDVITTYHKPINQVGVAYPGIDLAHFRPPDAAAVKTVCRRYHLQPPYLLSVGTLQPRKNLTRLHSAFLSLPPKGRRLNWVIVGKLGWLMADFNQELARSPKKSQIQRLGYVPNQDLPALYAGSAATLAVGIDEGFGLPPAEALACAALVVVSRSGALPEVVGSAGFYVDPYSVTSIRHGIMAAVSQSPSAKAARHRLGINHVKKFNWDQTAKVIEAKFHELTL